MSEKGLLLATTNQGKSKEIRTYLEELSLEITTLQELNTKGTFPESGKTFRENARGKSLFYSKHWKGFTLAEDSGLEIEHLKGEPGVYSARYSGPQATDEKNNQKVLALMTGMPFDRRKARFVSCMILCERGKIIKDIKECVEGFITFEKKGLYGFGYDPLFYYPALEKTFAELKPEEKNRVSHRGRALKILKKFLLDYLA